ncbi:alpha-hydroxy-acid oxidizing protein [Nitriliruptoria bacterium AS10]|nr:alpha-hydroxy acid oxidase [Salsipaludibacter albus]MBY5160898.1 alpha-hydroxy-acid oxidizing protein [Salsipaludibacter albus]
MDEQARDYVAEPAMDGRTLADNEAAFARRRVRPHVLAGDADPDTSRTVLGRNWVHPVFVAPTARHGLLHADGEVATARGARRADATMTVSTSSSRPLGDVASAAGPWWFQLYLPREHRHREPLVAAAVEAGAEALVLTADLATRGRREAALRRGRTGFPTAAAAVNLAALTGLEVDQVDEVGHVGPVGPDDVAWLAGYGLPVVVKGILRGDDARRAVDAGAAAVQVSNHGGRQLDGAIASLDALEDVVAAVGAEVPVLLDGGIRRGVDVLVALALGATAVGVGRPVLWGLAVDGADGVAAVLDLLVDELDHVMRLAGVPDLSGIGRDLVVP